MHCILRINIIFSKKKKKNMYWHTCLNCSSRKKAHWVPLTVLQAHLFFLKCNKALIKWILLTIHSSSNPHTIGSAIILWGVEAQQCMFTWKEKPSQDSVVKRPEQKSLIPRFWTIFLQEHSKFSTVTNCTMVRKLCGSVTIWTSTACIHFKAQETYFS